jgi:Cu/Ag efflux pump CusA
MKNGMLNGYVYVDVAGRDIGRYVEDAKKAVSQMKLPTGSDGTDCLPRHLCNLALEF